MSKRMLIDAAHPEQTRVAVVDGNRVEEFDFESQSKKQIRGNIYLAKVTRVEASLQAAFVDYGGNRHGFLAFNEIHPDYYQIPIEDRERLLQLEEEEQNDEAYDDAPEDIAEETTEDIAEATASTDLDEDGIDADDDGEDDSEVAEEAAIAAEAAARRRKRRLREMRRYKIQEVIKPGQVMLVQVSKEERGNKGAALSSYLSLAGRYCVLMPNTARGGGISRKISNAADRKRLKGVISSFDLAKGVGLIIRTAGSKRTKIEIKRDYEYLGRLWSTIREKTLASMAPSLVHEEGGLVRRSVRDLYDKDIEAVYVEGKEAYHDAHDFMKMLMPSHAARVKLYKSRFPIFLKYQVEEQLEAIYDPNVQLKSGGYLVIHQTEALVAIDVNSGRSTRERNIEATALKTNLEAADEACRQMRLRDLAGLLVIDFIDMDENKNIRAVEKRMKDALKNDRARVQMGRISSFGLMEISRQRRRASVIEGSSQVCPTCAGIGVVRSTESAALSALQALESEAMKGTVAKVRLSAPTAVALYLLNQKRAFLATMERELEMHFTIDADASLHPPKYEIEILERRTGAPKAKRAGNHKPNEHIEDVQQNDGDAADEKQPRSTDESNAETTEGTPKKRRRGRRGGRGRRKTNVNNEAVQTSGQDSGQNDSGQNDSGQNDSGATHEASVNTDAQKPESAAPQQMESGRKPRRRRKSRASGDTQTPALHQNTNNVAANLVKPDAPANSNAAPEDAQARKRPVRRRRKTTSNEESAAKPAAIVEVAEVSVSADDAAPARRPVRRRRPARSALANTASDETPPSDIQTAATPASAAPEDTQKTPAKRPVRRRSSAKPKTLVANKATENPGSTGHKEPAENQVAPKRQRRTRKAPSSAPKSDAETKAAGSKTVLAEGATTPKAVARPKRQRKPQTKAKETPKEKPKEKPVTRQKTSDTNAPDDNTVEAPKRRPVRKRSTGTSSGKSAKSTPSAAQKADVEPRLETDKERDGKSASSVKKPWWKGPFSG